PPLEKRGFLEYYSQPHRSAMDRLEVPDTLEASLDRIGALDEGERRQFAIALAWIEHSSHFGRTSTTAIYPALGIALEALLAVSEPMPCDACGQPRYAVTLRFREFLEAHVPGLEQHREVREALYKTRSQVVHGQHLFRMDLEPWHVFPTLIGDK